MYVSVHFVKLHNSDICLQGRMVYPHKQYLPRFKISKFLNPIFDRILDAIAYAFSLPVPSNVNQDVRASSDFYFGP